MDLNPAQPAGTAPSSKSPRNPAKRILPQRPVRAAVVIVAFTAVLYLVELVDLVLLHGHLNSDGIRPRTLSGLGGVLWAPFLHENWGHLAANTIPILVFGFLAMAGGMAQFISVTVLVWLVSGLGVWATAGSGTVTIGASGIAFGWLAFLLVRGVFNRSFGQILIALVLLFYWGSVLWGLLPGQPDISWQGHVFGAIGGVLAAFLATRGNGRGRTKSAAATPELPGNVTV
ncbi:MAG TPA: rhomboid family intramembrane serine protease [Pseudonocardiaceae bacterium]|nr:rhomboid family intramembrane serine protease [Pseudonocardiaceae bacterium]